MIQRNVCDVCGFTSSRGRIETYPVVPKRITEKAGSPDARMVKLCTSCYRELLGWQINKLSEMTYDSMKKRFLPKSIPDIIKEYIALYESFVSYKRNKVIATV